MATLGETLNTATLVAGTGLTGWVAANDAPTNLKNSCEFVCDGTADEVQINTALASYDNVFLTEGVYNIAAPILFNRHCMSLHGVNAASSTAGPGTKLKASANVEILRARHSDGTSGAANCGIYNILFDGNDTTMGGSVASTSHAVFWHSWRGRVENCHFTRSGADGLHVEGTSASQACQDTQTHGCVAYSNAANGFSYGPSAADQQIIHTISYLNGAAGFYVSAGGSMCMQIHGYSNGTHNVESNSADFKLIGSKLQTCGLHNLRLFGGTGIQIIGNDFKWAGDDGPDNTYSEIKIETGSVDKIVIANNVFSDFVTGRPFIVKYAIELTGTSSWSKAVVSGNSFAASSYYGTGVISHLPGTPYRIVGNLNYTDASA